MSETNSAHSCPLLGEESQPRIRDRVKKPHTVRCVVSRRSRRTAGAAIAWVVPPAMSRQTSFIKSNPREGVKKNLSEISEIKGDSSLISTAVLTQTTV